jgi:hypothetical protein
MRLNFARWFAAALLASGLASVLIVRNPDELAGQRYSTDEIYRGNDDFAPARLRSELNQQALLMQSYVATLTLERARAAIAAIKNGAPAIEARLSAEKPSEAKRVATVEANIRQFSDSMRHLHDRLSAGSHGDVTVGLRLLGPTDVLSLPRKPDDYLSWVALPTGLGGAGCVVLYQDWWLRNTAGGRTDHNVLGPCFWYGAFGRPGRGMKDWLAATKHASAGWSGGTTFDYRSGLDPRPPSFMRELDAMRYAMMDGGLELKCVADGGSPCTRASARPVWISRRINAPAGGRVVRFFSTFNFISVSSLGSIYTEFGPERFARLWRSDKSFEDAFADATGERLDAYERRAMTRDVGGSYHAGPWLPADTTVVVLVLCAALLGVTAYSGRRPSVA